MYHCHDCCERHRECRAHRWTCIQHLVHQERGIPKDYEHDRPIPPKEPYDVMGIPKQYFYGSIGTYNALVVDFLGPSLEKVETLFYVFLWVCVFFFVSFCFFFLHLALVWLICLHLHCNVTF